MVNIFDFTDFRTYLRCYYEDKKKSNPRFSYQLLAGKTGLNNRGFLFNIINGTKTLSKLHCFKLSRALGHSKKEAEYFENIVFFTQAKNDEQRHYFLEQALQSRSGSVTESHLMRRDQFEYFSKWYHSAIRSLIDVLPFWDDYEALGKKLFPPITTIQAKKSVKLLERLNLIARRQDGTFLVTEKSIKASDEISQSAKNRFYLEYNDLGKKAIAELPSETREVASLTLGISEKTYKNICKEIRSLKERIIEMANNDTSADRVYQYQYILFPLTRNDDGERKDPIR